MTNCKLATTPAIPGEVLPKTHQGEKHLETTFGTRDYILGQGTTSSKGTAFGSWGETGGIRLGKADSSRLDRFSHRLRNDHDDDDDDDDDIDNGDDDDEEEEGKIQFSSV